jgi:prepilin-type N-terminal cleavage/methylation domain-containing protein
MSQSIMMRMNKSVGGISRLMRPITCHGASSRNDGFTLIETMVALSIFTVGIMAVGAMLIYSMRTRVLNRQVNTAVSLAHERIEEIRKIATREVDIRYNTVLNFNYILSRDRSYGTIDGYTLPGFLSGTDTPATDGYTTAVNSINGKSTSAAEKQERRDQIRVLYDDGDMALHGDETAADGIWSCIEYVNMDTGAVKPQPEFAAISAVEKKKWRWILIRRTVLEPVKVVADAGGGSERTLSHATLAADVTDTTGADVIDLTVECKWTDMTRKERMVNFHTLIVRGSM